MNNQTSLTESLHTNELILQCSGEGIFGLDKQGRMTFVNAAAERMLGYTKADLGQNLIHHIVPHGKCGGCRSAGEICSVLAMDCDGAPHQCNDAIFLRKNGLPLRRAVRQRPHSGGGSDDRRRDGFQ